MRRALILLGVLLPLSACDVLDYFRSEDNFNVHLPDERRAAAEIQLCDRLTPMAQNGSQLSGKVRIDCEGSGRIVIHGPEEDVECMIGYVTPGASQTHEFWIDAGQCEGIFERTAREEVAAAPIPAS